MHPNVSRYIRMHPNRSRQVSASPKTSQNLEKLRNNSEILRTDRKKFHKGLITNLFLSQGGWSQTPDTSSCFLAAFFPSQAPRVVLSSKFCIGNETLRGTCWHHPFLRSSSETSPNYRRPELSNEFSEKFRKSPNASKGIQTRPNKSYFQQVRMQLIFIEYLFFKSCLPAKEHRNGDIV